MGGRVAPLLSTRTLHQRVAPRSQFSWDALADRQHIVGPGIEPCDALLLSRITLQHQDWDLVVSADLPAQQCDTWSLSGSAEDEEEIRGAFPQVLHQEPWISYRRHAARYQK